jgi:hypothetical protein
VSDRLHLGRRQAALLDERLQIVLNPVCQPREPERAGRLADEDVDGIGRRDDLQPGLHLRDQVLERLALRVEPARRGRARIERGVVLVAQDARERSPRAMSIHRDPSRPAVESHGFCPLNDAHP